MIHVNINSFAEYMKGIHEKNGVLKRLRQKIRELEGFPSLKEGHDDSLALGPIEAAFPEGRFPVGRIHEFISTSMPEASAASGFIAGLLGKLMHKERYCLWISSRRTLFPPGLKRFGMDPGRVVFVDVKREKDVLWSVEQALKCDRLAAVVGELREVSFAESQRLQLVVEQSRVTGFLHRYQPLTQHNRACATRWKITPLASMLEGRMPGVGFPAWSVALLKVRNGKPGEWQIEWKDGRFRPISLPLEKKQRHYA